MKEKRELMLFIMNEEESKEEEGKMEEEPGETVELNHLDFAEGEEIELKTIHGMASKGTMKLKGNIKGKRVIVLIDSGATHNFIHNRTVKEKNLYLEKGNPFAVTIGDGTKCTGKGVCKRVELELQGVVVVADFFAIELGNVDVILGMQWLDTTGTMKIRQTENYLERRPIPHPSRMFPENH